MARKPASMYREFDGKAYTRREYIEGVPGSKVTQYEMGDLSADDDEYPVSVVLRAEEECQIRHSALESARVAANKKMEKDSEEGYKMSVLVYPHHVLRENKQATGAGADRVSSGMSEAFGTPVGTAARVDVSQNILRCRMNPGDVDIAKDALRRAYTKIPCPCKVKIEEGEELVR